MQLTEQHIIGKQGVGRCEDAMVITDAYVAVVDGSTSKSELSPLTCGLSHGQIAARCVCEYLRTCPEDIEMREFCKGASRALHDLYATYRPELSWQHLIEHPEDRFTCSAIIYSVHNKEVWMVGDCHCLILYKGTNEWHYYDNPKPMEDILASRRAQRVEEMLADGATIDDIRHNDLGRASIIPALKESMKAQNKDYAVIDGFDIPTEKVKVINATDAIEIILASDGYPRLFPTLAASEQYLRDLLDNDPLLIRDFQATKCWHPDNDSFDDRCYIRFTP